MLIVQNESNCYKVLAIGVSVELPSGRIISTRVTNYLQSVTKLQMKQKRGYSTKSE